MRVALFATCLVDAMTPRVAKATVTVLERLGCTVEFPSSQTCCGQMHTNTGYADMAAPMVKNHLETFEPYEYVVTPSGSCAASIRHQHPWITRDYLDAGLVDRVEALGKRTYELSEFIVNVLGVTDVGAVYPHRVTYHPACHGTRTLGLGDLPLTLLHEVRGLELVELPEAAGCCGFGGTFAIKNADVSSAMLADKVHHILSTGAEACTAVDASCLLHIGGGLSRNRTGVDTIHLAEILASTETDSTVAAASGGHP
jgi:L-lactate dehydrogenase complex protein LldE